MDSIEITDACNQEDTTVPVVLEDHTSTAEIRSLESGWKDLLKSSSVSSPFLSWEWIWTWWQTFSADSEPWVVTARDSKQQTLVALVPLVIRALPLSRRPPYRELSFMGSSPGDPVHLDVLVRPGYEESVASKLTTHLHAHRRRWDVLRFDGVAGRSLLLESLLQRTHPLWRMSSQVPCPFIDLPSTWEQYHSTLDQKLRYNLRSRTRRLRRDADGSVSFRTVSDAEEVPGAIAALFALHDKVRDNHGLPSAFTRAGMTDFHRRVSPIFHRNGWLRLHFLSVGDNPVAVAYCFRYGDVVYFYQTGYDPRWARYGPGAAILAHAIQRSIEEGAREFDFLRGAEPYKFQWTQGCRADLRAHMASTSKGKLLISGYRVKRRLLDRERDEEGQPA